MLRVCVFLRLPYISAAQLRLGACAEGHIDRAITLLFLSIFRPTQACKYILEQSSCSILVVEDGRQLDKVWALRDQLPNLKKVHIVLLLV